MRLLLDTHVLLWWLGDDRRLGDDARAAIEESDLAAVSAATLWEISLKRTLGKLRTPVDDVVDAVESEGFESIAITVDHAWAGGALPLHHRDPFDRLLVAQARLEGLTIVTSDTVFGAYQVAVLDA